jgi:hypothetical protein
MICIHCKIDKPEEEFSVRKDKDKLRRNTYCKECHRLNMKNYLIRRAKELLDGTRAYRTPPKTKQCSKCGVIKPISAFKYNKKYDVYRTICKECQNPKIISVKKQLLLEGKKYCKVCKQILPIELFPNNRCVCKKCIKEKKDFENKETKEIYTAKKLEAKKRREAKIKKIEAYKAKLAEKMTLHEQGLKKCTYCGNIKPVGDFAIFDKTRSIENPSYYSGRCKECLKKIIARKNRLPIEATKKCKLCGKRLSSNKKHYCPKCKKIICNRKKNIQRRKKKLNDLDYHLKTKIRKIVGNHVRGKHKGSGSFRYTGCEIKELRLWIEQQFAEGMGWGNTTEWHIDHYVPVSYFNFEEEEQIKICFNWRNLNPLWSTENINKGNTLPEDYLQRIEIIKQIIENKDTPTTLGLITLTAQ